MECSVWPLPLLLTTACPVWRWVVCRSRSAAAVAKEIDDAWAPELSLSHFQASSLSLSHTSASTEAFLQLLRPVDGLPRSLFLSSLGRLAASKQKQKLASKKPTLHCPSSLHHFFTRFQQRQFHSHFFSCSWLILRFFSTDRQKNTLTAADKRL